MSITPSALTLTSTTTLLTSGSFSVLPDAPYPLPVSLPLATPLPSPPNQLSTPPLSYPPGLRSSPSSQLTMPPPETSGYPLSLTVYGSVEPSKYSSQSVSSPSGSPESTTHTGTSEGASLPPSTASNSNSGVSAPSTSLLSTSGLLTSSRPIVSSSLSSANPSSASDFIFTSSLTPTLLPPIHLTAQTFSSPASVSSSASHPTTSPAFSTSSTPSFLLSSPSDPPDSTTTLLVPTTLVTSVGPLSLTASLPSTSIYTITSVVVVGQGGVVTTTITSSVALSTEPPENTSAVPVSSGTIAAIVLGIVGALGFAALWLFCARRRHRKLVQEAALVPPPNHATGPLDDEILGTEELGYGVGSDQNTGSAMSQAREERYAGILAALHLTERFGRGNEGGSTGGVYGSQRDDGEDDVTRESSPTLPIQPVPPDDPPYPVLLSPPPPVSPPSYQQTTQPTLPPSAYYAHSRRKSSPGPDAAWPGGHSIAPSYAGSQTLGSGSQSGSVDALSRTWTGSEEPLLGIGKMTLEANAGGSTTPGGVSPTTVTDRGSNNIALGSAFGSPATSVYSPSTLYPVRHYDSSGSNDARTASGSGSYGYARSGTPSSFDVLGSVSSQGALSSAFNLGQSQSQGFRFGFSRAASSSSGGSGRKAGSGRHSFGVPPTSFRAWRDRGSSSSDKEKQSLKEKSSRERTKSPTSTSKSESIDEKQGRASPAIGVRTFLGRLRLGGGHTPSPHSSIKDLPSPTKGSTDAEKAESDFVNPPPIQVTATTPQHRRRFSFILSNPDPHPPSPYSGAGQEVMPTSDIVASNLGRQGTPTRGPLDSKPIPSPFAAGGLLPGLVFPIGSAPSPAPTEESRLAEGLLHPRLRTQGCSDASLRDFEDYSRPIGGIVKNRLYSTTTFGTQDDAETKSRGTPVQDVMIPGDEREDGEEEEDIFMAPTPTGLAMVRDSLFSSDHRPTHSRHSHPGA